MPVNWQLKGSPVVMENIVMEKSLSEGEKLNIESPGRWIIYSPENNYDLHYPIKCPLYQEPLTNLKI